MTLSINGQLKVVIYAVITQRLMEHTANMWEKYGHDHDFCKRIQGNELDLLANDFWCIGDEKDFYEEHMEDMDNWLNERTREFIDWLFTKIKIEMDIPPVISGDVPGQVTKVMDEVLANLCRDNKRFVWNADGYELCGAPLGFIEEGKLKPEDIFNLCLSSYMVQDGYYLRPYVHVLDAVDKNGDHKVELKLKTASKRHDYEFVC